MNHGKQLMHLSGKNPMYATACGNRGNHAISTRDMSKVECGKCKRNKAYQAWAAKQEQVTYDDGLGVEGWEPVEIDLDEEVRKARAYESLKMVDVWGLWPA
jgi:hypothetical protein